MPERGEFVFWWEGGGNKNKIKLITNIRKKYGESRIITLLRAV